jgi:NSS family neurotransmitter:Na+ symporter
LLGVPVSLGFGPWAGTTIAGRGLLDLLDFIATDVLLPLNALLLAVALMRGVLAA